MVGRAFAAAALFFVAPFALASATAPGQLDATFSGDGWLYSRQLYRSTDQRPAPRGVQDLAIQADGRIIVVGALDWNGQRRFGAYRFLADGSIDRSFATGGWVVTNVGDDTGEAHTVAVQRDGKIVLGGTTICPQLRTCIVLVRYLSSGALDASFGAGGIARTVRPHYGSRGHAALDLAIQPDGRIVALVRNNIQKFVVARYLPDGRLDRSFSRDGFAEVGLRRDVTANGLALQQGGRIVVVGSSERVGVTSSDFTIARLRANGTLDRGFSGSGIRRVDFQRREDAAYGVAVQRNGRIVIVGVSTTSVKPGHSRIALVRLRSDGRVDTAFGRRLTRPLSGGAGYGVAVQRDGRLVVAGIAYRDPSHRQTSRWLVLRYLGNGRLDRTFGSGGLAVYDFGTGDDYASSVGVQPDGKIVTGGQIYMDIGLARYLPR